MDIHGPDAPKKVFIVYSKQDSEWMTRVRSSLKTLSYAGKLEPWSDVCIDAGSNWKAEIEASLQSADAAVLLVSPDLLSIDFVQSIEIPTLLGRRRKERMPIIPVPDRDSSWEYFPWLHELMSYAVNPTPLARMSHPDVDRAVKDLCNKLIRALSSDRPWSVRDTSIGSRLRILCVLPRPISSMGTRRDQDLSRLDLRTEWSALVHAVKMRRAPLALLRLRPPTKEHLIDELVALADAGNYSHVIYLSTRCWTKGAIFEDEMGQAQTIRFEELTQSISTIGKTLPLFVLRMLGGDPHLAVPDGLLSAVSLRKIAFSMAGEDLSREAKSWADLFSCLARGEDVEASFEQAFHGGELEIHRRTPGPVVDAHLAPLEPYINEGVSTKSLPAGSRHFICRNKELVQIARKYSA